MSESVKLDGGESLFGVSGNILFLFTLFLSNLMGACVVHLRAVVEAVLVACLFHREKQRMEGQKSSSNLQSDPTQSTQQPPQQQQNSAEQLYREQKIQTMLHLSNLKVGTSIVRVCVCVRVSVCVCVSGAGNVTMLMMCVRSSVCRGIFLNGIQWCWTEGFVWVRPGPSLTGRGSWEHGEAGGLWCGRSRGSEKWRGQRRGSGKKTGKNHEVVECIPPPRLTESSLHQTAHSHISVPWICNIFLINMHVAIPGEGYKWWNILLTCQRLCHKLHHVYYLLFSKLEYK